jgi:predicted metal-binding membrane protein
MSRRFERAFIGIVSLFFAAGLALTYARCSSMSGGMPMTGGWTMSMAWMRMPGQTWISAGASFLGMWVVMMVAMMLPSFAPVLLRYRRDVGAADTQEATRLILLAGAGYFFVWTLFGVMAFPTGVALASVAMQQPALARVAPLATGAIVMMAGAFQFTAWKVRQLACSQVTTGHAGGRSTRAAWREGLRLGLACCGCCVNLMVVLLAAGVMDLRVMVAVTAAITAERVIPAGPITARIVGGAVLAAGTLLIVRAAVA